MPYKPFSQNLFAKDSLVINDIRRVLLEVTSGPCYCIPTHGNKAPTHLLSLLYFLFLMEDSSNCIGHIIASCLLATN